ncbi:MAG: hypothetical protein J6V12_05040 [Bacteroidaceae bacterium]|nr:hypothetical protein [Bacteroidaceae bacterium]
MNKEDRQIRALLQKADTTSREHEASLHARIMRQLPERSLRRIYLVIIFALLWGGGIALLLCYWQPIAASMLAVASSLLDHTLPSVETFTTFALCIGTVALIVTQSRDVMDEYYEHELKKMLDAL